MSKNKIVPIILCVILLLGSLPFYEEANADYGQLTITATSLNVRKGPGLSYPVAGSVKKGEKYSILSKEGDWIRISLGGGRNGWVASWFTSKVEAVTPSAPVGKSTDTGTVSVNGLRVRKGPGTNFQVIGSLNSGQAVEIISNNGTWAEIKTAAVRGWVSSEFLKLASKKTINNPAVHSPAIKLGNITADSLNVRETPSLNSRTLGQLKKGTEVTILSQSNGWTQITYSGKNAWISSQYIQTAESDGKPAQPAQPVQPSLPAERYNGKVTASQLNVRDTNSLNGKLIGSVSQGQSFEILEENNNWVKIEFRPGQTGWAAGWFFEKTKAAQTVTPGQPVKKSSVSILYNGTNIRNGASTEASVIQRANQGQAFEIVSVKGDWYEIAMANGTSGFVAGWIVSVEGNTPQIEKPGAEMHTKGRTIVIDPGHGGRDNGTTGVRGTLEKTLTLKTAQLLYDKLKASGTNVILTRTNDSYISLASRVSSSHYHNADAFISLHYDSINDRSVKGMTTYYYSSSNKQLGQQIHSAVISRTMLKDRGTRFGDYHVIRENRQRSLLLELGYLSNPAEEMLVSSAQYQELVTNGIFEGLARYFKNN